MLYYRRKDLRTFSFQVVNQNVSYLSVLSLDEIPDPERTHFLWGFSKDFGIASFRFGVFHTWNRDLMTIMDGMCLYSSVEGHIQQIAGKMLSDNHWLDTVYFPGNLAKLKAAFEDCRQFFEDFGCRVKKSKAGLFAWVDLSPFLKGNVDARNEKSLFLQLLNDYKLYIPNGTEFGSRDPGWFRVIFAIKRDHWKEFCRRFNEFAIKNRE